MTTDLKESECCNCNKPTPAVDYLLVHDEIENNIEMAVYIADEVYGPPETLARDYDDDILKAYLDERNLVIQECLRFLNYLCLPTIREMGYTGEPSPELIQDEQ